MTVAHPLQWPVGWPRTPVARRDDSRFRFKRPGADGIRRPWTFAAARDALVDEVAKLGGTMPVVSTNFGVDRYGIATDRGARPDDQGVALYFTRRKRQTVMACDLHVRAEENMRSLALSIEAMRQLERHGGAVMMDRAFEGFARLEAPGAKAWWLVLEVAPEADRAAIEAAFRRLARARHPDGGGSDAAMAELNVARDRGLAARATA